MPSLCFSIPIVYPTISIVQRFAAPLVFVCVAIKFNDMRNGIIEDDNLPFEVVHDKEIMDFIQQYQADIQYVIFVSKMVVKILKTSSIPDILTEKNYQNFATLPVIGLTIKYGGGGSISF